MRNVRVFQSLCWNKITINTYSMLRDDMKCESVYGNGPGSAWEKQTLGFTIMQHVVLDGMSNILVNHVQILV